ncbi:hypothetical protein BDF14DRAFT_1880153 [Spinellus fusiger]|nr:hypothetical protein BDF14DRAFT_1880153 [Spinellus fusiger]
MDIDGIDFINQVNQEIAGLRAQPEADLPINYFADPWLDILAETPYATTLTHTSTYDPIITDQDNQIVVLDTNFLISNLDYLKTLLKQAAQHPGLVTIVVPWIVVRELDGLKSSHSAKPNLKELVRAAMRFLETELRNQTPCLRGQRIHEVYDPSAKLPVTLLSNDRNLSIKAMFHDMKTISSETKRSLEDYIHSLANGHAHPTHTLSMSGLASKEIHNSLYPKKSTEQKPQSIMDKRMDTVSSILSDYEPKWSQTSKWDTGNSCKLKDNTKDKHTNSYSNYNYNDGYNKNRERPSKQSPGWIPPQIQKVRQIQQMQREREAQLKAQHLNCQPVHVDNISTYQDTYDAMDEDIDMLDAGK